MAARAGLYRVTREEMNALMDVLVRIGRLHAVSLQPASPARDWTLQTGIDGLRADLAATLRCIQAVPPRPDRDAESAVDPADAPDPGLAAWLADESAG